MHKQCDLPKGDAQEMPAEGVKLFAEHTRGDSYYTYTRTHEFSIILKRCLQGDVNSVFVVQYRTVRYRDGMVYYLIAILEPKQFAREVYTYKYR